MSYHTKYRPKTFDQVLGQQSEIKSIQQALAKGGHKSFVLSGPSGVGKTTIARIIASEVGCEPANLREMDAATHTGIDAIRHILDTDLMYQGFGGSTRVIIVDEAHSLSRQAWESLQKSVEEPPEHVYWVFCTTQPNKIPVTIQNRSLCYALREVMKDDIFTLLADVCGSEGLDTPEEVIGSITDACDGSPRRALTYLAACADCTSSKEAYKLMWQAEEDSELIIKLCRLLAKPGLTWEKCMRICFSKDKDKPSLYDENPESVRLVVRRYFSKIASGAKQDHSAAAAMAVVQAFSTFASDHSVILESLAELLIAED